MYLSGDCTVLILVSVLKESSSDDLEWIWKLFVQIAAGVVLGNQSCYEDPAGDWNNSDKHQVSGYVYLTVPKVDSC